MYSVYSFNDIAISLNHPSVGAYSAVGEGIGDVTISYAADRTAHDVSSDGYVMVSKIKNRSGNITLNVLQVYGFNDYLYKWWNYIEQAPASEYADMTITLRSISGTDNIVLTGVAPQKPADKPFQAQGQTVSWTLMAADIDMK